MKINELDNIRERYKGVSFHAFSELYSFLREAMNGPKEPCFFRQLSWMLAEIEILVLTGDLLRARREYQQLCGIVFEAHMILVQSDVEYLHQYWDASVSNIVHTPYYNNPDFREIVDGVTNQLKTLLVTQQ